MKKLKLLATCLLFCLLANNLAAQLQQIKIVSFTVKNQLPANIDSWISTPAALILVAQKVPGPIPIREPRLVVQIRSGGAILCGNTPANARPVDPFDVRTFNTTDLTGFLTNCHELKAGTYTICVQFFNIDKVAISQELCKEFKVEDAAVEYSPPTLITPDNGKKFTAQELQSVVTFRWTPLVPKPKEPVTYRLKVWQLMQGQNATTAMRTNQPIVTKDVDNITQAIVSGIYTGPCRPPYLCDYIWQAQALNRSGKPMGNNNGMSEPYTFGLAEEKTKCPSNLFPEDKKKFAPDEAKKEMLFRWTPNGPPPSSGQYRLKVWQLMQGQSPSTAMRTNPPIVTKDVDNITQATVNGIYTGPCRPPYLCDYIWAVELMGAAGQTGCTSEPTTFSVTEENVKCPGNLFPEDKKKFTPDEAKKEMLFRWTPVVPKPQEPVTYRLKVWQLMQGQSGAQAMRTNMPIVTKDVDNLTEATVSGIYTGPCRPPYLCDYIWMVEAVSKNGSTSCTGEPTSFSVIEGQNTGPENTFPEDKKEFTSGEVGKPITFRWTPITPKPQEPVTYRLRVWQLMQGQNASSAMKTNQPIVTKDVANLTEASVSGIYTGPCKPPYLCDFIWNVQALNREGKPIGGNNGMSDNFLFRNLINYDGCPRQSVSWANIAAELNIVSNCAVPFNGCDSYDQIVTAENHFIWDGSGTHAFSVQQQNSLMATAKQWALNNRPSGCNNSLKSIISITYITEVVVDLAANANLVGISVKYGCCTEINDQQQSMAINLVSPANGSIIAAGKNPMFTWSTSVKPPTGASYKIKIVEIIGDQSPDEAIRSNKPHFEKGLLKEQFFQYTSATAKLEEGKKYAWNVQVLDRQEKPIGENYGTSNNNSFSVSTANCVMSPTLIETSCISTTATTKTIRVKIKIANVSTVATPATIYMNHPNTFSHPLYTSLALTATNLVQAKNQSFVASPGVNSVVAAVPLFYPTTITQGNFVIQEVDVNINNSVTSFNLLVLTTSQGNTAGDALVPCYEDILIATIPPCPCTYCTDNMIVFNGANTITDANNILTLNNNITIPGIQVKQFKAELIGFSYAPSNNNEQCWVCNKDDNQWGNFTGGTFSSPFPSMVNGVFPSLPCCGGNSHHTIGWWGAATTIVNKPLQLKISLPPASTLSCCPYRITLCIRYTFTDSECRSCSVVKCFNYIRQPQGGGPVLNEEINEVSETDSKK